MSEDIVYDFEWDPAKALSNVRKHGITFDQAATVLVVEDELIVRELVCAVLSGQGYDVYCAETGADQHASATSIVAASVTAAKRVAKVMKSPLGVEIRVSSLT